MKVFITGISSFLGSHLARQLEHSGHEVHGSARQAQASNHIQAYTLGTPPPANFFGDCTVVIHCAWDIKNPEATNNSEATRLLVEAAKAQGVRRQIFISSLSAREDAPTLYGRQKFHTENYFDLTGPDLILRPGLIVGEGGLFRQTFDYLRDHRLIPLIDGGHFPMPLIGLQELTLCIQKLIDAKTPNKRPLRLFHKHIPSQRECLKEIAETRNWRRNYIWLPSFALLPGLALFEFFKLRLPITRSNVMAALKNRFSPEDSDLDSVLGYEADYASLIKSVSAFH